MQQPDSLKFNVEFEHDNINYVAYIIPIAELTDQERKMHMVKENSFLVHLFEPSRVVTFELFIGEDLEWQTTVSSVLMDSALLGIIGEFIDRRFM